MLKLCKKILSTKIYVLTLFFKIFTENKDFIQNQQLNPDEEANQSNNEPLRIEKEDKITFLNSNNKEVTF